MDEGRKKEFIALIRDASPPLPVSAPPALEPAWEALVFPGAQSPLRGIRAVLFDIYGTLFSSAAGEIGFGGDYPPEDLDALAAKYVPGCTGKELNGFFRQKVRQAHARLYPHTRYPEVKVEEIWAALFAGPLARYKAAAISPEEFALRYELAVNPVFPNPGIPELFKKLTISGITLGLISNAQFFTPLLFEAFWDAPAEALGCDPRILLYSYEWGEAKPSPVLFEKAAAELNSRGIPPEAALFVGNDMLNDISAAASRGFQTALFAGDARSLRLREAPLLRPGRIIRSLSDIPALVGRRLENLFQYEYGIERRYYGKD
ncbi:MAG: HAD family hydrolase [Spirochaetaceae bacterium]|jgi:putative hydrolase of the HAD superfamily|nr:HAD family hydrolase [Spirochaetaceae bacterium]